MPRPGSGGTVPGCAPRASLPRPAAFAPAPSGPP